MSKEDNNFINLSLEKLDINEAIKKVVATNCGAVSSFIGTTRDFFENKRVLKLEYEAYEPMAVKEINSICKKVRSRWKVEKIAILHRLGQVPVGEASVVIVVSSEHRKESLESVQFIIDELKSTVPIWKKEIYDDDKSQWKQNSECLWKVET